jgi:hypothetical protein
MLTIGAASCFAAITIGKMQFDSLLESYMPGPMLNELRMAT